MAKLRTRTQVYQLIAKSLQEFGYPDVSSLMIQDTFKAMKEDKPIPHGIIGKFAESQLREVWDQLQAMPE